MRTIKVVDLINSHHLVTQDEGQKVFNAIRDRLDKGESFVLDFEGITLITACCLNVAIGQLYGRWDSEYLNVHIKIKNLHWQHRDVFRAVTDNAKEYFAKKGTGKIWQ